MSITHEQYRQALANELMPAMGCTEPIALAYAAAVAGERLGGYPETIIAEVSRNIVKNVKSVIVPNTGGLYGIEAAVVAGFVSRRPQAKLEVLAAVTAQERQEIGQRVKESVIKITQTQEPDVFFIKVTGTLAEHTVSVTIRTSHTNITEIVDNGQVVFEKACASEAKQTDTEAWTIQEVIAAARVMPFEEARFYLERQLKCNLAIAQEGLSGKWGANIGQLLIARDPENTQVKARAWAAAGSDARMNGCEMPVVIVSGSGNQGITASVPVAIFAQDMGVDEQTTLRALLLSDLITIALKQGIGKLSAYCGAVSAGCGSAAAIAYLKGFDDEHIQKTITNALAISSGLLCDGAKASCAAKIAMSVEGALMAVDMVEKDRAFRNGDGIVQESADATAAAVGRIASLGMVDTDRQIIREMLHEER